MTFTFDTEILHLPFRDPFRIARHEDSQASQTVLTYLERDGAMGLGECFPVPYYGETVPTTEAVLPLLVGALEALGPLPADRVEVLAWLERSAALMGQVLGNHGGAKMGVDTALHDMAALVPIVQEAGGRFTSLAGEPGPFGQDALASNGMLHDEVLGRLKG